MEDKQRRLRFGRVLETAITGAVFVLLRQVHAVADLPLWLYAALLATTATTGTMAHRLWGHRDATVPTHARVAAQAAGITTVIYATGWGPLLSVGYIFGLAGDMSGSPRVAWQAWGIWSTICVAAGQLAIAAGIAPTLVDPPMIHGLAVLGALGSLFVMRVIGTSVIERAEAEEELRKSEASFRLLFRDNPHPMWVFDTGTLGFLRVNEAACAKYGYSVDEFEAMTLFDIRPAEDRDRLVTHLGDNGLISPSAIAARHLLRDGRVIDVDIIAHPLAFEGHDAVLVLAQDITDRLALEHQLRHRAFHDPLTDLANRALFQDRVQHAIDSTLRVSGTNAVLFIDLDGFKVVNDSLGHGAGDDLLIAVGQRLKSSMRPGDTIGRLGGDEFAVLLERMTSDDEPVVVAQRVQEVLRQPFPIDGREFFLTASIGIAVQHGSATAEDVLRRADVAMYEAKRLGKARHEVFRPALQTTALQRLEIGADLQRALERRQFELLYQPTVSVHTGLIDGGEALIRWAHPQRGVIRPDDFIPLAEESGLIVTIGRWVLHEALRQARAWQQRVAGMEHFTISVNVSGRQLEADDFIDDVRSALESSGIAPSDVILEMTESVLMQQSSDMIDRLNALKRLGVQLAIDDFGTGYSSLSYLRMFPVDILKIDRCFIRGMTSSDEGRSFVRAIIDLGKTLSLATVAEGVEREDEMDEVRAAGCDVAQGYLFARPLAPEDLEVLLRDCRAKLLV